MTKITEESTIRSTRRIKPTPECKEPVSVPLSIADATTATFGASSALWVFDRHGSSEDDDGVAVDMLIKALSLTLAAYPHFAGRLQLTPWPVGRPDAVPHTQRFRRAVVEYGRPDDPGVVVQLVTLEMSVDAVFPDVELRSRPDWCWNLSEQGADLMALFDPTGEMAGNLTGSASDAPAVRVRITMFTCHSLALTIKIAHPLADAEAMIAFVKAWGVIHAALWRGEDAPRIEAIFDPMLLDRCAAGDIDGPMSDSDLMKQSTSLPLPRFDWWAHEPGKPAYMDRNPQVTIPLEIPSTLVEARIRGARIPWEEWDTTKPVNHRIYRITSDELSSLYAFAQTQHSHDSRLPISRHDVLLAFVWQLIAQAKPPTSWPVNVAKSNDTHIFLDTTLGLRPRLGLPSNFVGSPVLLAGMSRPYSQVAGTSEQPSSSDPASNLPILNIVALAATAASIRAHLARFDRPALAAWLHEQAFELAPQRFWNGFLGSRHTMATSWVRAGVWDVNFGSMSSSRLRWAGVIGPVLDGLVVLTEACGEHIGRDWWRNGVDVDVKLEAPAADRVQALFNHWRDERRTKRANE